jgi:hypothetical protein
MRLPFVIFLFLAGLSGLSVAPSRAAEPVPPPPSAHLGLQLWSLNSRWQNIPRSLRTGAAFDL